MAVQMTFPNFPVADIRRATDFYLGLGFEQNPMFSDETTSCIVVNATTAIMLLEHERYDAFLVGDQRRTEPGTLETLTALLLGSRDEVDDVAARVERSGGTLSKPVEETEFGMYGGQATDPDGHVLDVFFMEAPQG